MRGPVKDSDVLVLKLDVLDYKSHSKAHNDVIDHFGKVCASVPLTYISISGNMLISSHYWTRCFEHHGDHLVLFVTV